MPLDWERRVRVSWGDPRPLHRPPRPGPAAPSAPVARSCRPSTWELVRGQGDTAPTRAALRRAPPGLSHHRRGAPRNPESCLDRLRAMARLRRSKLAAGFLLLFQCLSERCQLAGGETPRQSRGKRGRYLPGGAGPGSAAEPGAAWPGQGRAGVGGAGPLSHSTGSVWALPTVPRASYPERCKRRLGVGSACSRGRPGVAAVLASHPSFPRLLRKSSPLLNFFVLMRIWPFLL